MLRERIEACAACESAARRSMAEKRIELIERLQSVAAGSLDNAVVQSHGQYGSYGPDLVACRSTRLLIFKRFRLLRARAVQSVICRS